MGQLTPKADSVARNGSGFIRIVSANTDLFEKQTVDSGGGENERDAN